MLARERRSQSLSFVVRPPPSRGVEGNGQSIKGGVGVVPTSPTIEPREEFPSTLPRRSRSWTGGAVDTDATSPPPPPALAFDGDASAATMGAGGVRDGDGAAAFSLLETDRARMRGRRASLGDASAATMGAGGIPGENGGSTRRRRPSRTDFARAASERRPSNGLEAAVSDAWATLERLDDLVLGNNEVVHQIPTSPSSVVNGPGTAAVLEEPRRSHERNANGTGCCEDEDEDENDSLDGELVELERFEDIMKKELDVTSLAGSVAQRFLNNEEDADLQQLLRGSGLIVDFPEKNGDNAEGYQARRGQQRRNRRGIVRALVQITGDIGLALRLLQFWRRGSESENSKACVERGVPESQQHRRRASGQNEVLTTTL